MLNIDQRIDAYIERSQDFAKPILRHIRELVHQACPNIQETMKWSMPHFDFKGPVCNMAAFKRHCAFGFWKQQILEHEAINSDRNTLSTFGKIASLEDLPQDKVIIELVQKAVELNEKGIKVPARKLGTKQDLEVPEILLEALARDEKAAETFAAFPYSSREDYVEWIADAKTDATRDKRLATAIEWLSEGKRRNWKYEKC